MGTAEGPEPALHAGVVLGAEGTRAQTARLEGRELVLESGSGAPRDLAGGGYFVEALPVEMHCHSIGQVDFSDFSGIDLIELNAAAAREGVVCVPTVYLRHDRLEEFVTFMRRFHELRKRGALPFVPGMALEGPLLASHGGTPAATVWPPNRHEWERLAMCGRLGLLYMVISPDSLTPDSDLYDRLDRKHPDLPWIIRLLVESGVRPALGHYTKADAARAAELTYELVNVAWSVETPLKGTRVVTDHLFNDMPLPIKHAFRTRRARERRDALIASYDLPSWNLSDLPEQVGPVAAAIMRLCAAGRVASCVNFDGEHVDLAIAARAVEVVDRRNIMLMTDRCDAARLGGQALHHNPENSLWYQDDDVVAAGSQPIDRQIGNARAAGVGEDEIWDLVSFTAYAAFGLGDDPWLGPGVGSFVLPEDAAGDASLRRVATLAAAPPRRPR
ncbi:hypothetical protein Skr01_53950 [Sphaerisporangium krabiense]|uniref:N-acetylglucosamine-6-phosphate deacetylase n=1 Tax=Sphaerisporangium krabiense TaxID=763782 RepID=A0A7W8Z4C8_9ACTN|nr:hypothetical protein [Sphaerisporangium krabiense]MBB5627152.1 N-acetylglucosamine-6-phosphate deacetylase [Sphaerisporangium krabiense]GII65310.1 hypothetical protein Skr01_53950 [Sphaerisporangium krabiense]